MRTLILSIIILFILFCTVPVPAQVSPVSNLDQKNTSIINNNMQVLQTGINALQTSINSIAITTGYFISGILGSANGGTGANLSACIQGSTPYYSTLGVLSCLSPGTNGQVYTTQGASANPHYTTLSSPIGYSLVSITNVSAASSSGVITLVNGNIYFVVYTITVASTDTLTARFNADSSSHYQYASSGSTTSATIRDGSASASGMNLSRGVSGTNSINGSFYIQELGSTQTYKIWGENFGTDSTSGLLAIMSHGGTWSNSANLASFQIDTTGANNYTGTIYLYQLKTS